MITYQPFIQSLSQGFYKEQPLAADVLRLDLIDPAISGNKWFKLKKNLDKAQAGNFKTIITFGGAYSNHIAATAAACKTAGLQCIGIIRGEETAVLNPTLFKARENGMHLHFVNREWYSEKMTDKFMNFLFENFGAHYLIPEGGNNKEGLLGCTEIIYPDWAYDYIICACGTATTYAGILASAKPSQKVIGISVLKGDNKLPFETEQFLSATFPLKKFKIGANECLQKSVIEDDCITNNYAFNGYAKFDKQLLIFKNKFEDEQQIKVDHVYTAKLFYSLEDLIAKKKFKSNARLLIVHSGGLQGNAGFEARFKIGL